MLEAVFLLSLLSLVRCCPYVVDPSSLNVSQGTPAQFSVVVCGSSANVVWAVNNVVYPSSYNFNGISVVQEALSGDRTRSNLTLATSSTELDNTPITSTVYAPQAVPSDTVILRIQGLLGPVIDLDYDVIHQRLSWTPPFTLSGVPISHYMITINNNNLPLFTTNSSLTTLDLNGTPCQYYNAIIAAVNAVGEGQSVSLNYTHVGVPDVYYINDTGTINNESFVIEVSFEIRYNCTEQIPDRVHAVTRNMYSNSVMTHSNQTLNHNGMLTGSVLSDSYSVDELLSDGGYVGQLVFETEQGLTVKTREFNLWTFDLNSVTIIPNESGVCVNVSYTSGSEALGFVIKTSTRQWNVTRNHTNTTCVTLADGVHQVRVFDWNADGSIPEKWRKEATVTIALPHTSQSHSSTYPATPHISSSSTITTSIVSAASTKYVSSSSLYPTVSSTVGTTNNTRPAARNNTGVIAGVTVAVLLPIAIALIVVIIVLAVIWKRRKGRKYNASWRPSSWTDYNEPSDYPTTSTTEQPWTGVRLTEVVDSPATDAAADTQATDSTALSEKATGSYLTDCTVTDQDPPPYSSHYVVPHGSQSHFPTQRETTSNETQPSGKESHYADIQVGGKQAAGRKPHNKLQERVVYSKIKAPPYALPPKSKGAQPRNLNIAVPFSRHSSGLPRQDQGYSSSNQQSSSDAPHDYGAGAVTYLSASQQAQNNNDDSFSLVASNPAHIDQLQHPAVSSTNSHSNYSKNTSSTTTVC